MICVMLFVLGVLLRVVVAVPPHHDGSDRPPFSLVSNAEEISNNASLVGSMAFPPSIADPVGMPAPFVARGQDQWHIPEIFKRQIPACYPVCGSTTTGGTLSNLYCSCSTQCCGVAATRCCRTTIGETCCGDDCCQVGATCGGNTVCSWRVFTVTYTTVATSYRTFTSDQSSTATAVGGTLTITSTISSVNIVTISSAEVATIFSTVTIGARGLTREPRPVDTSEQPVETSTSAENNQATPSVQHSLVPVITPFPPRTHHIQGRQAPSLTSTVTYTISTVIVDTTYTRTVVTTLSARDTTTVYTTLWRTETTVINAAKTTTATTTLTRGQSTVGVAGGPDDVTPQSVPDQNPPKRGLSRGAQIGIGAGTAGGSLIICIILGFICRRRRKSRKQRNQEMIDTAVTTAMAAQQNRISEPQPPPNRYSDGKQLSTAGTSLASPHPYSPTPPLHSPQQGYVYPPPRDHTPQLYKSHPIPESSVDSQSHQSFGPPRYEGSEVETIPIQRYELQQFSSPAPVHAYPHGAVVPHPGAYSEHVQSSRNGVQRGYSDLPEVRASDLPEMHRR